MQERLEMFQHQVETLQNQAGTRQLQVEILQHQVEVSFKYPENSTDHLQTLFSPYSRIRSCLLLPARNHASQGSLGILPSCLVLRNTLLARDLLLPFGEHPNLALERSLRLSLSH